MKDGMFMLIKSLLILMGFPTIFYFGHELAKKMLKWNEKVAHVTHSNYLLSNECTSAKLLRL